MFRVSGSAFRDIGGEFLSRDTRYLIRDTKLTQFFFYAKIHENGVFLTGLQMNSDSEHAKSHWLERPWFTGLAFGIVASVYLVNQSPFVSFHDSISFLLDAASGFNPATNATSHLLYNNFQRLLVVLLPFMPHVLLLTLLTITCSVISLYFTCRIAFEISGNRVASVFTMVILAFSFTWWQQSEIIEVYTFNAVIFLAYVWLIVRDLMREERNHLFLVSLLVGLGLLTHIQHLLSLPFFAWYLFSGKTEAWKKAAGATITAGLFAVLLLPPVLWETNSIKAIFFDRQFEDNVMNLDFTALQMGLAKSVGYLIYNFHIWLFFIVEGIWLAFKNKSKIRWQMGMLLAPYFLFGVKYNVDDNYVFFLSAYLVMLPFAALSFEKRMEMVKKWAFIAVPALFLLSPLAYGTAVFVAKQLPQFADYDREKAYKGGVSHIFWPGKAHAQDPLELARDLQRQGGPGADLPEWNYPAAAEYLELVDNKD